MKIVLFTTAAFVLGNVQAGNNLRSRRQLCENIDWGMALYNALGNDVDFSITSYDVPQGEFCVFGCQDGGKTTSCGPHTEWIYNSGTMNCPALSAYEPTSGNTIYLNNNGAGKCDNGAQGTVYFTPNQPYAGIGHLAYTFRIAKSPTVIENNLEIFFTNGQSNTIPASSQEQFGISYNLTSEYLLPQDFSNYVGTWDQICTECEPSFTASFTNSQTTTQSNTQSFSQGVTMGGSASADGLGVSASYTATWSTSMTTTFANMNSETWSYTCSSGETCEGTLYQWNTKATDQWGDVSTQTTCNFWCVPTSESFNTPQCPPGYCGNTSCSCCNRNDWAEDPSQVPMCS